MTEEDLPEHVRRNREVWDQWAAEYVAPGERAWAKSDPDWGVFGIPDATAHVFPDSVAGMDTIELGCGTAYVSAWLARLGAHPTGIDNSEQQLATARRLQDQHDIHFPLIHGNAENVPLPDASFDLAISEYGASIWADPHRWIPEAARLLRPGGQLIFLVNGTFLMLTVPDEDGLPATDRLIRDYFGMHRFEWPDDDNSVEFHLGYGDWIRLLRANGFDIQDMIELRPEVGMTSPNYPYATNEWARRWPAEEVWKARKRA